MKYTATIVSLGKEIGEEIVFLINENTLSCFVNVQPAGLKPGFLCTVTLDAMVFDEYEMNQTTESTKPSIIRIGESFSYISKGVLKGNSLKIKNVEFEDEVFMKEFPYLDGKMVSWKIDRLDAEILDVVIS
jgi:hypothetical protein